MMISCSGKSKKAVTFSKGKWYVVSVILEQDKQVEDKYVLANVYI